MASNLLMSLGLQIAGGAAASYVDRTYPDKGYAFGEGANQVRLSPGAIGAVVGAVAVAILPLPGKEILANMIGGALVYEGTKFAEDQVLPRLTGSAAVAGLPQGAYASPYHGYGLGVGGAPQHVTTFELDQALMSRAGYAQA